MNWKRGLFRGWVVVSALWLLFALPMAVLIFSEQQQRTPQTVDRLGEPFERSRLVPVPRPERPPDWQFAGRVWEREAWVGLAGAFAVPVILLGAGAAVYWVAAGFREDSN